MAGYSKRTLAEKLGIKDNTKVIFINPPNTYIQEIAKEVSRTVEKKKMEPDLDFIHFFTKSKGELESNFPFLKNSLVQNGMIWISWPKGQRGVETDLNENIVRDVGLKNGLVDIKVCAVDNTWSGLKFVIPVKDRT
jgi:hypothetical protein